MPMQTTYWSSNTNENFRTSAWWVHFYNVMSTPKSKSLTSMCVVFAVGQ